MHGIQTESIHKFHGAVYGAHVKHGVLYRSWYSGGTKCSTYNYILGGNNEHPI